MSEWKEVRLGDICSIFGRIGFSGYTTEDLVKTPNEDAISLSPSNIVHGDLNFEKLTYINWNKYEESPEIQIKKNDILLVKTGSSIGRTTIVNEVYHPMTLNPQMVVLKDIKINPLYLSYLMKGYNFQGLIRGIAGGSAIPTLSQKHLSALKITICDIKTQNEIAKIISPLDSKIAVNRRICENLEAQAQALFKHWFIDFAPFLDKPSGKAERKNGKFVESELGMIPEGWRVGKLEELVDIKYGKDHKKLNEGNIPAYGSAGLMRTVDEKLYDGESVLIPRKGTLNNIMYVNEAFWTVDTMFYTIPKKSNILKYLYMKLKRIDFNKMNVGTSIPSNSTSQLNKLKIVIPTDEILSRFDGIMSSLLQEIMHSQKESKGLATLRDALLPKLMSGQIKVNEMEKSL